METLVLDQNEFTDQERDTQARIDFQTRFSETLVGSMRTEFNLYFDGVDDLVGEDGRSLKGVANKAVADAEIIVRENPKLAFELPRRITEGEEIDEIVEMAKGDGPNTIIVLSDQPHALKDATEDIGGYNVTRKQTMMRIIMRQSDGTIRMISQSLDGSNREALEAIYRYFGVEPEEGELLGQRIRAELSGYDQDNLADNLTGIHDLSLTEQFDGEWYAGRRPADYRNTYDFVCKQHDLIETCVRLQSEDKLDKYMLYNVAATMQKRFDKELILLGVGDNTTEIRVETINISQLYREIEGAGNEARYQGITFSGCGETLSPDGAEETTLGKLEMAGYGNKSTSEDCEFVSKKCPVCDAKNVKTTVKLMKDGKKHVSGSCGCSKLYNSDGTESGAVVSFASTPTETKAKEKRVSEFFGGLSIKETKTPSEV